MVQIFDDKNKFIEVKSEFLNINNSNNSINWIEEAILKKHIKYYDYKNCLSNVQIIGKGHFGEVFRVNYKDSEQYLALKSFFNFDIATVKEIVHEVLYKYNFYCLFPF
jgi:hypothetical protein